MYVGFMAKYRLIVALLTSLLFLPLQAVEHPTTAPATEHAAEKPIPQVLPAFDNELPLPEELKPAEEHGNDRFMAELMNMLFTLGLIILLILGVSWVLKRMLNTRVQQINTTSLIKVLERRVLSPKTSIYVLEIDDVKLVIADSHNGVFRLAELPLEQKESKENGAFEKLMQEKLKKEP